MKTWLLFVVILCFSSIPVTAGASKCGEVMSAIENHAYYNSVAYSEDDFRYLTPAGQASIGSIRDNLKRTGSSFKISEGDVIPHEFKTYKGAFASLMLRWGKGRIGQDGYLHFEPLVPEAPSRSYFHWNTDFLIEDEIKHNGLSRKQFINILTQQSGTGNFGALFVSANPTSSAVYGSYLMEIEVYKDFYPYKVTKNGQILWHRVSDALISDRDVNLGEQMSHSIDIYQDGIKGHFYTQDLRIIKNIKWPDKDLIKSIWFGLKEKGSLKKEVFINPRVIGDIKLLQRAGAQWLFTPNYSSVERLDLINQDPEGFFLYFNQQSIPSVALNGVYPSNPSVTLYNNVLNAILNTDGVFFDPHCGRWNFKAMKDAVFNSSAESLARIRWFSERLNPESPFKKTLEMLIFLRDENFEKSKNLARELIAMREKIIKKNEEEIEFMNNNMPDNGEIRMTSSYKRELREHKNILGYRKFSIKQTKKEIQELLP